MTNIFKLLLICIILVGIYFFTKSMLMNKKESLEGLNESEDMSSGPLIDYTDLDPGMKSTPQDIMTRPLPYTPYPTKPGCWYIYPTGCKAKWGSASKTGGWPPHTWKIDGWGSDPKNLTPTSNSSAEACKKRQSGLINYCGNKDVKTYFVSPPAPKPAPAPAPAPAPKPAPAPSPKKCYVYIDQCPAREFKDNTYVDNKCVKMNNWFEPLQSESCGDVFATTEDGCSKDAQSWWQSWCGNPSSNVKTSWSTKSPPAPKPLNVAGYWLDSNNMSFDVKQNGTSVTSTASGAVASLGVGKATIAGNTITWNWSGNNGITNIGTIIASNGNATKITWKNGIVWTKQAGAPPPPPPPPSGKCIPNVPALALVGNPILDVIAGNGCKNYKTQAACGPIGTMCPQCCIWQPA